jgi:hypothetical protein
MSHPGTIKYVDLDTGIEKMVLVNDVPEFLRFVENAPIVRVEARTIDGQRTIREFGPNGEVLRSTPQP